MSIKQYYIFTGRIGLTTLLVALLFPMTVVAESGAKSLFISIDDNENSTPIRSKSPNHATKKVSRSKKQPIEAKHPDYTGLQYWIDLQDDNGGSRRVTTSHNFTSGDRIKLRIKSNSSGYLYVINQDASGQQTYLYPANGQKSELIQPGMVYTIPDRGTIRFDNIPSNEKITVALAKFPLAQPSNIAATQESMPYSNGQTPYGACTDNSSGSKRLYIDESNVITDCIRKNYSAGTKGMYSEEDTASNEPASYSVLPADSLNNGKVMFVDFNLIHR